jgi:hypothetical protein
MPLYIFPLHKFGPETIKVDVVPRVISGGAALNGEEDVIQTDGGGRWEGSIGGLSLNKPWQERLWGAWTSYWAGGARAFLMPVYSLRTAPRPVAGNGAMRPSNLIADDDVFPTTVGFASPYIKAQTVGGAALRATTMTALVTQGARIEPGMRFSYGARSYKIERVTAKSGYQATFTFSPPAREAIANGAALNFDWPLVQCRIATGQDLAPAMSFGRFGSAGFNFVEDFSDAS